MSFGRFVLVRCTFTIISLKMFVLNSVHLLRFILWTGMLVIKTRFNIKYYGDF